MSIKNPISLLFAAWIFLLPQFASSAVINANPSDYLGKLANLMAGDTLLLAAGSYTGGFNITDRIGTSTARITISGPGTGAAAIIEGRSCCNTVQFRRSEYIDLKNVTIDGKGLFVDGINAKDGSSHHITIESNILINLGAHQQMVGINTKSTVWDWVIRNNQIIEAGTGIYLGNSTGSSPFIGGIIEGNYIVNPIGYCMQIKHQNNRPNIAGIPTQDRRTIIRNNVFIKDGRASSDGNRPNLLLDGFPDTGNGANDIYEVYGNFLFNNPRESLAQLSGRIVFHDNILVQPSTSNTGLYLVNHNRALKLAYIYNNTIYGGGSAIRFGSTPAEDSKVIGNLLLSTVGIGASERAALVQDNIIDTTQNAILYVKNPNFVLNNMDFYPLTGKTTGTPLDLNAFAAQMDFDVDFNGNSKGMRLYRGAYAGDGVNPGWQLQSFIKQGGPSSNTGNLTRPSPPTGLKIIVN